MENNKIREPKPVYLQEISFDPNNDEISLVDLILILIRRKKLFFSILILTIAIGMAISLVTSKYSHVAYTTTIKIGAQVVDNTLIPLETPETLLAKIQHSFIPLTLNESQKVYSINASIPKKSELVLLEVKAIESEDNMAIELLNSLTRKIEQDHNNIYATIKNNLEANLKPVSIEAYAAQIAGLQKTYAVSPPIKATKSDSRLSKSVILGLSLFVGLFLAIFAAFFAEFWHKVKAKMDQEKNLEASPPA